MDWKVLLRLLFIVLITNSSFLIADEPILSWHTFAGSVMDDASAGIAVDPSGNIYLAGWSDESWGSPINPHSGGRDAFVAKLNSLGGLEWNTFLGSSYEDRARAIAVDGSGNVYVVGYSKASWGVPGDPFLWESNAFAAKLNTNGHLQWHKFMTPDGGTMGTAVTVDAAGNVYVAGWGGWVWYTPPVEPFPDHDGAFVAKLNSSGAELWHAFMGSATPGYYDRCTAVDVASNGNVYVAGWSTWNWGNPINPYAGDIDAFAAKFDSNGFRQWNTFMGSSGYDSGWGIALDGSENVHVVGGSAATWGAPVNPHAGGSDEGDAFAAKLDSSGVRQWNTFMGAEGSGELGWDIAVDAGQNVYVTGGGRELWGKPVLPVTGTGSFVAELNRDGVLQWNMFMKAILDGIALDGSRNIYVSGGGDLDWGTPVNPKAGPMGSWDAFVAKIETTIEIDIDIKPGGDPNSINLCSNGAVPIAILGSDTFDVYDIDTETLRFAEASVKVVGMKDPHSLCSYEDVNDDLFYDLVCHFLTADIAGIDGQTSTATVNGELLNGTSIEGTDSVNIVKDTCN